MAGITSTKKIKGQPHLLAYITPNEVEKLKALGGQETMTEEGIPAYPEFDNYGYSSQADFDAGDVSRSNDPNVRNVGTFETYRGNKNIGVDLALKAKYARDKKAREEAKKALAKGQTYGYGPNQTYFQKMGTKTRNYNINQRNKYINRILKARMDKINAGLKESGVDFYGDTKETYQDFIDNYGKSITAYGPEGTGLYSQKMIDDVLSNKRVPPDFFTKVTPSGGLYSQGAAALANFIGPKMAGPVTQEKLNQLYKEYQDIQKIDPTSMDAMSTKQMMEIYEPNRYKLTYGDGQPDGDAYSPILPIDYNTGAGTTDDVAVDKTFDYRFGTGQSVGADVLRGYVANGGRITRANGGIMNAVPRQGFFLGGIGRAIGKIGKAAGKVLKSDLGKAALTAAAFYYGGGGRMPFTDAFKSQGFGGFKLTGPGSFFSKANPLLFSANKAGEQVFNPLKMAGLITLGGAAMGPAEQDTLEGFGNRGGKLLDSQGNEVIPSQIRAEIDEAYESGDPEQIKRIEDYYAFLPPRNIYLPYPNYAVGGRVAAQEGGLMNLGGMEKDYRAEGGFVPIGREEKADDVPARLSVNEFVFTADAVRNAGGGDIDKGAEVMENMMKNLENGGRVSEESQGNTGAQGMFSVSERIGEVI